MTEVAGPAYSRIPKAQTTRAHTIFDDKPLAAPGEGMMVLADDGMRHLRAALDGELTH
jgi:hypothetical protein